MFNVNKTQKQQQQQQLILQLTVSLNQNKSLPGQSNFKLFPLKPQLLKTTFELQFN